ncbi:MAG: hypothetical protein JNL62_06380 [Bryobacterales bacterium]|nr:hypothetical protein [Bryobacterales bacterium]
MLAALTVSISPALDLCVRNEAGLDHQTLMLTLHHIRQNQDKLGTTLNLGCSEGSIRLTFALAPAAPHPADALGATRTAGGKILPDIRVFTQPVSRMLPSAGPECRARALAKVAAHELSHYLRQDGGHGHGLDQPTFDAQTLLTLD